MARKRGLGKGLDALLQSMNLPETSAKQTVVPGDEGLALQVLGEQKESASLKDKTAIDKKAAAKKTVDNKIIDQTIDKKNIDKKKHTPTKTEDENIQNEPAQQLSHEDASEAFERIRYLPVEWLKRGQYQPRNDIDPDSLEELASSIKLRGVIQPLVVRPLSPNGADYEIVAGERRWRASQLAGLDKVPCVIKIMADEAALAIALIENIQREDLNPIEEASALLRLQEEFQLTHQQIADAVGKSRTTITNVLRLNILNSEIKRLVEHGDIEVGHAKALLVLSAKKQMEVANLIIAQGLSVRQTEALVRKIQSGQSKSKKEQRTEDPNVRLLQQDLSEKLGASVSITHTAKGAGKVVVKFNSLDELDGILTHIK